MDSARHQLLSGPAGPGDEHRGGAGRYQFCEPENLLHLLGRADQRPQGPGVTQLSAGDFELHPCAQQSRCVLQDGAQATGIDGLGDVIISAHAHGLDGAVNGALRGHHDYSDGLAVVGNLLQQLQAAHARHFQIRDDDRGRPDAYLLVPLLAISCRLGDVSP